MTDLLALARAMEQDDLHCTGCGVGLTAYDPFTDRLTLMVAASVWRNDSGGYDGRCEACA